MRKVTSFFEQISNFSIYKDSSFLNRKFNFRSSIFFVQQISILLDYLIIKKIIEKIGKRKFLQKGMISLSPNSAENFEDQGGSYVFSMYIKIFRDISTYILTRYRFYNDSFIVKPQPRANTIKKKNYNTDGFLTSSRRLYLR